MKGDPNKCMEDREEIKMAKVLDVAEERPLVPLSRIRML